MSRLLIILLLIPMTAGAQDTRSALHRLLSGTDSAMSRHYRHANIDTLYLSRPTTRWTLKARANLSGAGLAADGVHQDRPFTSDLKADYKGTVSVAVSYLGLSLGAALNPGALAGRYTDYELNLNSYGNRMGLDMVYQRANSFEGWAGNDTDQRFDIERGQVTQWTLNVNGYYAFNHRRFSYPAAFTQSYIQRRSCGSWLVGASVQGQGISVSEMAPGSGEMFHLRVWEVGIGGGYGYNLVLPHQWLLHLSALPTFIVYSHRQCRMDGERERFSYSFPEVIITGRGAIVHSFSRYFVGSTMVFNASSIGSTDQVHLINTKWRIRAFVGIRL